MDKTRKVPKAPTVLHAPTLELMLHASVRVRLPEFNATLRPGQAVRVFDLPYQRRELSPGDHGAVVVIDVASVSSTGDLVVREPGMFISRQDVHELMPDELADRVARALTGGSSGTVLAFESARDPLWGASDQSKFYPRSDWLWAWDNLASHWSESVPFFREPVLPTLWLEDIAGEFEVWDIEAAAPVRVRPAPMPVLPCGLKQFGADITETSVGFAFARALSNFRDGRMFLGTAYTAGELPELGEVLTHDEYMRNGMFLQRTHHGPAHDQLQPLKAYSNQILAQLFNTGYDPDSLTPIALSAPRFADLQVGAAEVDEVRSV